MDGPRKLEDGSLRTTEAGDRRVTEGYFPVELAASLSASGSIAMFANKVMSVGKTLVASASLVVHSAVSISRSLVAQGSMSLRPTVSVQLRLVATSSMNAGPKAVKPVVTLRGGTFSVSAVASKILGGTVQAIAASSVSGEADLIKNATVIPQEHPRITEGGDYRITEAGDRRIITGPGSNAYSALSASALEIPFNAGFFAKKNGLWGPVTPYVFMNGAWRTPTVYVKRNGDWLRVY